MRILSIWVAVMVMMMFGLLTVASMSTINLDAHKDSVSPRYRAIPPPNECTRTHVVDPLTIIESNTCRRCCGDAFSRSVHARAPLTPLLAKHYHPEAFATTCRVDDDNNLSMCCSLPGTAWECVAIKD